MVPPPRPLPLPDPHFELRSERVAPDAYLVEASGDLDVTAQGLRRLLDGLVAAGGRRIVVDVSALTVPDTTTLDALLAVRETLAEAGGALELVAARADIRRYFSLTGLDLVFAVHDRREDALAALSPAAGGP